MLCTSCHNGHDERTSNKHNHKDKEGQRQRDKDKDKDSQTHKYVKYPTDRHIYIYITVFMILYSQHCASIDWCQCNTDTKGSNIARASLLPELFKGQGAPIHSILVRPGTISIPLQDTTAEDGHGGNTWFIAISVFCDLRTHCLALLQYWNSTYSSTLTRVHVCRTRCVWPHELEY